MSFWGRVMWHLPKPREGTSAMAFIPSSTTRKWPREATTWCATLVCNGTRCQQPKAPTTHSFGTQKPSYSRGTPGRTLLVSTPPTCRPPKSSLRSTALPNGREQKVLAGAARSMRRMWPILRAEKSGTGLRDHHTCKAKKGRIKTRAAIRV